MQPSIFICLANQFVRLPATCMSTHVLPLCNYLSMAAAEHYGKARPEMMLDKEGRCQTLPRSFVFKNFLASFLNLNAQANTTGNLIYLTISAEYKQCSKEFAPPHVSPEYFRKIWLLKFPDYRLAKRTKNSFYRCTKCDALGLAYKNAKTILEQSAFTYFENELNVVSQLYF